MDGLRGSIIGVTRAFIASGDFGKCIVLPIAAVVSGSRIGDAVRHIGFRAHDWDYRWHEGGAAGQGRIRQAADERMVHPTASRARVLMTGG
jgi:hypothetical protein